MSLYDRVFCEAFNPLVSGMRASGDTESVRILRGALKKPNPDDPSSVRRQRFDADDYLLTQAMRRNLEFRKRPKRFRDKIAALRKMRGA